MTLDFLRTTLAIGGATLDVDRTTLNVGGTTLRFGQSEASCRAARRDQAFVLLDLLPARKQVDLDARNESFRNRPVPHVRPDERTLDFQIGGWKKDSYIADVREKLICSANGS